MGPCLKNQNNSVFVKMKVISTFFFKKLVSKNFRKGKFIYFFASSIHVVSRKMNVFIFVFVLFLLKLFQ